MKLRALNTSTKKLFAMQTSRMRAMCRLLLPYGAGIALLAVSQLHCAEGEQPAAGNDSGVKMDGSTGDGGGCLGCMGCCLRGKCEDGNTNLACGRGGLACALCQGGNTCVNGTCLASGSCNAATCADGCCDTVGGCWTYQPDSAACGLGGAPCAKCETGEECKSGVCAPATPKTYAVVAESAILVKKNSPCGGTPLLGQDVCDSFLEVSLASYTHQTKEQSATFTPLWDERLFLATEEELLTNTLKISALDADVNADDHIGKCEWSITAQDLFNGAITAPCGDKISSLTIYLVFCDPAAATPNPMCE